MAWLEEVVVVGGAETGCEVLGPLPNEFEKDSPTILAVETADDGVTEVSADVALSLLDDVDVAIDDVTTFD